MTLRVRDRSRELAMKRALTRERNGPQPPCIECGRQFAPRSSRLTRFCSSTCRVKDWRRLNPERARAISRRQDAAIRDGRLPRWRPRPGSSVRVGGGVSVRVDLLPPDWADVARLIYETRKELKGVTR